MILDSSSAFWGHNERKNCAVLLLPVAIFYCFTIKYLIGARQPNNMDKTPTQESPSSSRGFSLFGRTSTDYSNTELAGVPLTGMSPLSPYLNVDPRYLIQDSDEFILPTGANKTRGRFELAFFTIGSCCITGAVLGSLNGLRMGLSETRQMAWSKPRNVQILNMVTRQGATWANTLGSVALLYSVFGVAIEKARGAEDDVNTVVAGTMTGLLFKSPGGLRGAVRGGLAGLALSGLYALYNNWDHLKGNSPTRY